MLHELVDRHVLRYQCTVLTYQQYGEKGKDSMKNVVICSFDAYNERRYGRPWICQMTERGGYNFNTPVGIYTAGERGGAGDLVVFEPTEGVVYGYGQKDYRGNNTTINHAIWDGEKFVACDKLGRVK